MTALQSPLIVALIDIDSPVSALVLPFESVSVNDAAVAVQPIDHPTLRFCNAVCPLPAASLHPILVAVFPSFIVHVACVPLVVHEFPQVSE